MGRVFLSSSLKVIDPASMPATLESLFQELEDQINGSANLVSLVGTDRKLPVGMQSGDVIFDLQGSNLLIGLFNGSSIVYFNFGSLSGNLTDAQHGSLSGGSLHAAATASGSGFMVAADKVKLDTFKGRTSSGSPPSTTEFPNDGDWGFHHDTVGVDYYLAINYAGVIKSVQLT